MMPSKSRILERRYILHIISICCLISFGACANYTTQQGVQNKWRDESLPQVQIGTTTHAEVAQQFGPPSQVIALLLYLYLRGFWGATGLFPKRFYGRRVSYSQCA